MLFLAISETLERKSMKKYSLRLIMFSLFCLFPQRAMTYPPNVVSANGFTCSKYENTVSCSGSFPGINHFLSASGVSEVTIMAYNEFKNQHVKWTYDSSNGCLSLTKLDSQLKPIEIMAIHQSGEKRTYTLPSEVKALMQFCNNLIPTK